MDLEKQVKLVYWLPGRVCLRLGLLDDRPQVADELREALEEVPGINSVKVVPEKARVVVRFDRKQATGPEASAAMRDVLLRFYPDIDAAQAHKLAKRYFPKLDKAKVDEWLHKA
jgi:copper chaperone CopZ